MSGCMLCYSDRLKYYLLLTTVLKYPPSEMYTKYETKANFTGSSYLYFINPICNNKQM